MYNERQGGSGSRQNSYNGSKPWDTRSNTSPQPIEAEPLPEDYVKRAEEAIAELKRIESLDRRKSVITTSKLRSLFSLFAETYNQVSRGDQDKLDQDQQKALNAAKVRIYYEIGRDDYYNGHMDSSSVGRFIQESKLLAYLNDIGNDCKKLLEFYHYMEALVAFHRFYFGEKKDRN